MKPLGINWRLQTNATNQFLKNSVIKALPFANEQMKGYALSVTGDTKTAQILDTAQVLPSIFNIKYSPDGNEQEIKLPSAIINKKSGDCKSFSLLIAGFLTANNIPNGLAFVGYPNELGILPSQPTHVYNFAIVDGKKIYVDGTLKAERIPFNRAKEKLNIEVMNVNLIASPYENEIGKKTKAQRKETREKRREEGKGLFQTVKKLGLAPGRGAFLAVVGLNVHGMATRLKKAIAKDPKSVEAVWKKMGGRFDKLKPVIESGAKKKRILGVNFNGIGYNGIGVVAAATLAAAAPVIIAVVKMLKGLKVEEEPGADIMELIPPGAEELPQDFTVSDPDTTPAGKSGKDSGGGSRGFELSLPVVGAAAIAAFFIFKK